MFLGSPRKCAAVVSIKLEFLKTSGEGHTTAKIGVFNRYSVIVPAEKDVVRLDVRV